MYLMSFFLVEHFKLLNFGFGSVCDPIPSGLSGHANSEFLEFVLCNEVLLTSKSLHSRLELRGTFETRTKMRPQQHQQQPDNNKKKKKTLQPLVEHHRSPGCH